MATLNKKQQDKNRIYEIMEIENAYALSQTKAWIEKNKLDNIQKNNIQKNNIQKNNIQKNKLDKIKIKKIYKNNLREK